jgi:hypothetical protein
MAEAQKNRKAVHSNAPVYKNIIAIAKSSECGQNCYVAWFLYHFEDVWF